MADIKKSTEIEGKSVIGQLSWFYLKRAHKRACRYPSFDE